MKGFKKKELQMKALKTDFRVPSRILNLDKKGPLYGDRAPQQHSGERALQLGSSACAVVVVVANTYLTYLHPSIAN